MSWRTDSGDAMRHARERADEVVRRRFGGLQSSHPFLVYLHRRAAEDLAMRIVQGEEDLTFEPSPLPEVQDATAATERPFMDADRLADTIRLPALPKVFLELRKLLERPQVSYAEVAELIMRDPRLTASLLKLVNSPLFGFTRTIDTVSRAVAVAGMRSISSLAIGTFVLGLFRERPPAVINMQGFWLHSVAVALVTRSLAERLGRDEPERYFVAGLLHDFGWLAMAAAVPAQAREVVRRVREEGHEQVQVEAELVGCDHAQLGAALLARWNLPPSLLTALEYHHMPSDFGAGDEARIIHVADLIVKAFGIGASGDARLMRMDEAAVDMLGVSAHDIDVCSETLIERSRDFYAVLLGGVG